MQENISYKPDDTIRLVKCLSEHPKIQRKLYDGKYEVSPEECLEIIELLEKNAFFDMILILLMRNQHDAVLAEATSKVIAEKFINEWTRIGTEQLCKDIKERIRQEIKLTEARKNGML